MQSPLQTPSREARLVPLQQRDLNVQVKDAKMNAHSKHLPSATVFLDTPPPSSPMSARYSDEDEGISRAQRSSSITALLSSSPVQSPADHLVSSAQSPVKAARQSRQSFGTSHASIKVGPTDPHAGLEEISLRLRDSEDYPSHVLYGSYTHALLIGRSKPSGDVHASSAASMSEQGDIEPASGIGSKPTQNVSLPNSARHVSRMHAIVEWLPFSPAPRAADRPRPSHVPAGGFVVRILGQNGLIVGGKRRRQGHVLRLEPDHSVIDFFGVKAAFCVRAEAQKPISLVETERAVESKKRARSSLPSQDGSSPVKRKASVVMPRSASQMSLADSQAAVSQMLGPSVHSKYVKASTLQSNAQAPLSPPSSSPVRVANMSSGSDGEDDDGAEEPASPTLERARGLGARSLPVPTELSLGASQQASEDMEDGMSLEDEETASPSSPGLLRAAVREVNTAMQTPEESDLSSPSPEVTAVELAPIAAKVAATMAPPAALPRGRPLTLTNSQMQMPPPKAPASAVLGSAAALLKDNEQLRNTLREEARSCVSALAPTYDLEGLLAGAIVFHRTATISASEAVRSVLASNQGLLKGEIGSFQSSGFKSEHQQGEIVPGWGATDLLINRAGFSASTAVDRWASMARRAWTEQLESILQSRRMFGQIQRAGKDASGNSLEHWYYYDKEGDDDTERAANLGALAKPIRGALKTHKPIFWKKSAYPRTADEDAISNSASTSSSSSSSSSSSGNNTTSFPESQFGPAIVVSTSSSSTCTSSPHHRDSLTPPKQERITASDQARIWEETQPEEREKTWDPVGDLDWSRRSAAGAGSAANGSGTASSSAGKKKKR